MTRAFAESQSQSQMFKLLGTVFLDLRRVDFDKVPRNEKDF